MAEFIGGEEKLINNGEPIVFENNTDSDYEVNMGVVFRKSGLYEVSVTGKIIIISNVPQRKKGTWINYRNDDGHNIADCDQCGNAIQWFDDEIPRYCCMCGADMRGESE